MGLTLNGCYALILMVTFFAFFRAFLWQNSFLITLKMQNNVPTLTSQTDDEISLLDILVVVSENIKLLVIRLRLVP